MTECPTAPSQHTRHGTLDWVWLYRSYAYSSPPRVGHGSRSRPSSSANTAQRNRADHLHFRCPLLSNTSIVIIELVTCKTPSVSGYWKGWALQSLVDSMLEFFGKWLPISRTLQLAEPSRFPLATKVNRIPGMLPKQV